MVLEPIGPEPPATYWLRRAGALVVLLVLVVLGVKACGSLTGSDGAGAQPGSTPTPTSTVVSDPSSAFPPDPADVSTSAPTGTTPTTASSTPTTPKPTTAAQRTCTDADTTVTAQPDTRSYRVGTTPRLTLTVTNASATACRRDLGSAALSLVVTSGPARIWSSDDCKPKGTSSLRLLNAGASYTTTISWPRTRTNAACSGTKGRATAGTYVVVGRAGAVTSTKGTFILR